MLSSNGEAKLTSIKMAKEFWLEGCQICGSQQGHVGHERMHRIVTGTQRIRVTNSRLGFSQIRASSSIRHQQVHPQASSSTTAETGCPVPAGGSRGPQTLSEIPSPPANVPGKRPRSLCWFSGSLRIKTVSRAWAEHKVLSCLLYNPG